MDIYSKPRERGKEESTYALVRESGGEGAWYYTLLIRMGEEECRLPDIGRTRAAAERVRDIFARGQVTPLTAREVVEELLAQDPDLFC